MNAAERWIVLEPLDTLVVRDGRAFDAGMQAVARTVSPTPSTVAGAIGAAYGAKPGAGLNPQARGRDVPERLVGPVAVVRRDGMWRARWPVPFDIVREHEDADPYRLEVASTGDAEHDLNGQVDALLTGAGDPAGGWWETGELAAYLASGGVSSDTVEQPWAIERRVGLALGEDGTAAEGMLYSSERLRPVERMGFAVRCVGGPDVCLPETIPLGGRGGCAQVHELVDPPALPEPASKAPDGRLLLYLAAPAVFADGWLPDLSGWDGAELVAAALGDPQVIATATPVRSTGAVGGGRLTWAVPAGSVYYLKFPSEQAACLAATTLHRSALPQAADALSSAGFGFAFTGSWEPK